MNNDFLQSFLKTGLFEIGDNDDRLNKLKESISELQKLFEDDNSLLPKYTLVAIDPNILDTEPTLLTTEEIVIKHWETLRSKYPDMPRNILRGVILNALNNVGINNSYAARMIYLTASNLYPYVELNQEKELIEKMLFTLGNFAEENAIEEWSLNETNSSINIATFKLNGLKFGEMSIDNIELKSKLLQAVGNSSQGHTPAHGGTSSWGEHFAQNTSEGITSVFNNALKNFGESLSPDSIEKPINKFFQDFKKSLDINLKASIASSIAIERRSKLLWWKETLYSSSLKCSYRELNINVLPVVLSYDLSNQVPDITPISVDYVLQEILYLLNDKKNEKITFEEYLKNISEESISNILKSFLKETEIEGRISITDFIGLFINKRLNIEDFQLRTGIKVTDETSISKLAVSLFHDILVKRLEEGE